MDYFSRVKASINSLSPADFDKTNFEVGELSEPDFMGRRSFTVSPKTFDGLRMLKRAGLVKTVLV